MINSEDLFDILLYILCFFLGMLIGFITLSESIEIQGIERTEKGYYITINNEIYYKEVEK